MARRAGRGGAPKSRHVLCTSRARSQDCGQDEESRERTQRPPSWSERDREELRDPVVLGGEGLGQSLLLMMGKGRQALMAPGGAQLPQPIPIRTLSHL